jgi:hypothetical protein
VVEHFLGKEEVKSSILFNGSITGKRSEVIFGKQELKYRINFLFTHTIKN